MSTDDRMETITDPAEIRASDEPDERGDFPRCTTPAPVGAAVALDLDAARAMLNAANTIKATGGAVEIGGVRIEPCDEYGSTVTTARAEAAEAEVRRLTEFRDWWKASSLANAEDVRRLAAICHDWRDRSEAAEAEVVTLRAQVNGLHEELLRGDPDVGTLRARLAAVEAVERGLSEGWVMLATVSDRAEFVRDLRAALAVTTGEGE